MTTCEKEFPNGSQWLRVDFHLHTKADKEFSFCGDNDRFCSEYVNAVKSAGIGVGVITNHNKFDYDEFKGLRKVGQKNGICFLPGIELSVGDGSNGIHALIIFSDEWLSNGHDYINQFLNVAFQGKTPNQYGNANGRTSLNLLDTIKKLEEYHKDFFLVFAHVEEKSGLWTELNGGRLQELGASELFRRRGLGFQKVRTHDKPDCICRTKVKAWLGEAYPAEVEGSDPKSIGDIGRGEKCFLKIGDFSFEVVKYALLDHVNRLASQPQRWKHSHIKSLSFDGGVLDGKTINLSPQLNTFIGIRGSGKSSILEVVRAALDIPFGEKALDTDYKKSVVEHTLGSGGKVTLKAIDRRGQQYEIRRINREKPDVYIDGILQPGISIRETILHKPIYFGQKDLSSTGDGFEKDLVEKLVGEKLSSIRVRISEQSQKVKDVISRIKKLSNVEDRKKEYRSKQQDSEHRLKLYKQYGVEEKLQKQIDFDVDDKKCSQVVTLVSNYLRDLESFVNQYEDDLANHKIFTSKQNKEFFEVFFLSYEQLIKDFDLIKDGLSNGRKVLATLDDKVAAFGKLKDSLKEEFAEIERKLAEQLKEAGAQAIRPEEFKTLRKTLDHATDMLQALEKEDTVLRNLERDLFIELDELSQLWHEEFKEIKSELNKVNEGQTSLRIEAEYKGDKTAFVTLMKDVFRGSKIREATFQVISSDYADFVAIYKHMEKVKSEIGGFALAFEQYLNENLEALLTFQVPNRFVIKYRDKELKHHSLGQRASALILFVLSQQENDVFIIDQPEDDLDNQTIYEDVIKLIVSLKPKAQFLFATHNANFPVLGDAEQIIACSYSDDKIETRIGSIDCPTLQQAIVAIMEGGEEAFKQRKRRYEVWKPQS